MSQDMSGHFQQVIDTLKVIEELKLKAREAKSPVAQAVYEGGAEIVKAITENGI